MESSGRQGVDLLLTNQWPMNVTKFTGDEFPDMYFQLSTKLAKVVDHINPRYIVTSSCEKDLFYQRSIYVNSAGFATRFVSLSSFSTPDCKTPFKDKYVHALSIKPLVKLSPEELVEKELDHLKATPLDQLQSKLPPGMRNPFFLASENSGESLQSLLLQEKLELGKRLIQENKIKSAAAEDSEDSEEDIRNGKITCIDAKLGFHIVIWIYLCLLKYFSCSNFIKLILLNYRLTYVQRYSLAICQTAWIITISRIFVLSLEK